MGRFSSAGCSRSDPSSRGATGGNSGVYNTGMGGASANGGATGSGGASGDRGDAGVSDAESPPTSYTITGGPSVHDPTVILAGGVYYSANSGLSLWTRNPTNLTSWTNIKQGLGGTNPGWIKTYVTAFDQQKGDLWAPDFVAHIGKQENDRFLGPDGF
jgi:hypothetical protein